MVASLGLLTGCGGQDEWATSTDPVDTGAVTWMSDSVFHLGDTVVDPGRLVGSYVVAGDGFYFLEADDVESVGQDGSGDLWFIAPGDEAVNTGLEGSGKVLRSPSGRHVVVLDHEPTKADVVVIDLDTGDVDRTDDRLDARSSGDPEATMGEAEVDLLGITDEAVFVRGVDGNLRIALEGLDVTEVADDDVVWLGADLTTSPDGEWRIEGPEGQGSELVHGDEAVTPRVDDPYWHLDYWVDDRTVVGASTEQETGDDGVRRGWALMSCTVPDGVCTPIEETRGKSVFVPADLGANHLVGDDFE